MGSGATFAEGRTWHCDLEPGGPARRGRQCESSPGRRRSWRTRRSLSRTARSVRRAPGVSGAWAVPKPLSAQSARSADESCRRRQPPATRKCALGRSLRSRQSGLAHGPHDTARFESAVATGRTAIPCDRSFCANAADIRWDGLGDGGVYWRLFGLLAEAAAKLELRCWSGEICACVVRAIGAQHH